MKRKYLCLTRQLEILGFQLLTLGLCIQHAHCAGQANIPGFYGSTSAVLPQPAVNALPSGATVIDGINNISTSGSTMTVHQGKPRAVIHWQNFDIGNQATVNFDQQDSSWKALNRVTGDGYSQIFGSLNAKGQVYILNQNGILFGPGSQVNVHSLTASALNLKDEDFLNLPSFSQGGKEVYIYSSSSPLDATVANHGTITAGNLGSVFLIGPQTENNGTITAQGGRIGLLAGDQVDISQDEFARFSFNVENNDTLGISTNFSDGAIYTKKGLSVMQGGIVNQDGLVRAVTALEENGRIVLQATKKVHLGATSKTEVLIDNSGDRKVVDASKFTKSTINISANDNGSIIEHYGQISAPGGYVNLTVGSTNTSGSTATSPNNRIYIDEGSSIDVGGSWVALAATDRLVDVQLNSQELRDAFVYKNGPLKGQELQVDIITGLPFNDIDISGYLTTMAKSAPELTTRGGSINLQAHGNGEIIVKKGASLDFSGGGLIYGDGFFEATKVRVGNKMLNLEDVLTDVSINEILGSFEKEHTRFGITDTWQGLYYGGSSSYRSYLPSFIQGASGGELSITSKRFILDGTMNGSVLRGIYQNALEDPTDTYGHLTAIGRKVPRGGTLAIGEAPSSNDQPDMVTDAIVVTQEVTPTTVSSNEPFPENTSTGQASFLSASLIEESGLGYLQCYANFGVTVEKGVDLALSELGSVIFASRHIENQGTIRIPSGSVTFRLRGTGSSEDRIFLDDDSLIDVSGRLIDNSTAGFESPIQSGFTFGGDVKLLDDNADDDGAIILAGHSTVNVSGGYMVNRNRTITSGKAGSITIRGNTVQPDGNLFGLALEGSDGGTLTLHADKVTVSKTAPSLPAGFKLYDELPETIQHHLILAENDFVNSGFTHISLKSETDLLVEEGATLTPSETRIAKPLLKATGYQMEATRTVSALPENFGSSSIALAAHQKIFSDRPGSVIVEKFASIFAGPNQGTISLQGDSVLLAGNLKAPGGDISLSAIDKDTEGDVMLAPGATIDVSGTTLLDPGSSVTGMAMNHAVVNGGSINLSSLYGSVIFENGSSMDVSGSAKVANLSIDNKGGLVETSIASQPGSVTISFFTDFTDDGLLKGDAKLSWLPGGSLTVSKTDYTALTLQEGSVTDWQNHGFDNFTFSSMREIQFSESPIDSDETISIAAKRGLALNGSALVGRDGQEINLSAPWLQLSNVVLNVDYDGQNERTYSSIEKGTAHLSLHGDFIDIHGNIALSGFADTMVHSTNDLRLYDYSYYQVQKWSGALRTAGNLSLQATAIYPAMHHAAGFWSDYDNTHLTYPSAFTFSAGLSDSQGNIISGQGGTITILPSEQSATQYLYSAGGKLTLKAADIENYGLLTAPMGEIVLNAENSITLFNGSTLSTRGEAITLYGHLQNEQWKVGGYKDNISSVLAPELPVNEPTEKSISITATTITQDSDAKIDVSGGGSIFAYQFLPGYDGSVNPLGKNNRYVIMPDNSVILPGKTVYLESVAGLESGTYSLLPAEFAFIPGALVIEATNATLLSGESYVTPAGYTVTAGYISDRAITESSPFRSGFIVRAASDVLAEGKFDTRQIIAGNAGLVEINAGAGSSTIAGTILGEALTGYSGGGLKLSADDLLVGSAASMAGMEEDYDLVFEIDKIRKKGLRLLQLGNDDTKTVTLTTGSIVEDIPQMEVKAKDSIILKQGVQIHAQGASTGQKGTITLTADTLYGSDDTLLHASDELHFNINNLSVSTFTGALEVDHGTFEVNSGSIFLEPASYTSKRNNQGVYLSASLLDAFQSIDNVILKSARDMVFLGDVDLTAKGDLTLNSAHFTVDNSLTTNPTGGGPSMTSPYTIKVSVGGTLGVENSGAVSSRDDSFNGNSINLVAETVAFGPGAVLFDTFKEVHFTSNGDTIFQGIGSLKADLSTGDILTFNAARYLSTMTSSSVTNADGSESLSYALSDFQVNSAFGDVIMAGNGHQESSNMAMPGQLTIKGQNIYLDDAHFNMPGSTLHFMAKQDLIAEHSSILAKGERLNFPVTVGGRTYDNAISLQGGQVTMESSTGQIEIDTSSIIDTSATSGQAGGAITLSAPTNGVFLNGTVKGDHLSIYTNLLDDFGALSRSIAAGGFTQMVDLRARTGNVTIGQNDTVTTKQFILSADQGTIDIFGTIDVSGQNHGGRAEIWSMGDLTLQSTGQILAKGEGPHGVGGSVYLASANGSVRTVALNSEGSGSLIDVSGETEDLGGNVTFRVSRDVIGRDEMLLDGQITGVSKSFVHAFRAYNDSDVTIERVTDYIDDIVDTWSSLQALWNYSSIKLIPEIEVWSNGTMALTSGLDSLNSLTERLSGTPGVFTFRATGDLNVTTDIIDAPLTSQRFYNSTTGAYQDVPTLDGDRDSWNLNFIAGADRNSARLLAVNNGKGNFTIGNDGEGALIYTQSGDINFAAGNDVTIYASVNAAGYTSSGSYSYMPGTDRYNLASFDGVIRGYAGHNLDLEGGVIQTAVSDITLQVDNNVILNTNTPEYDAWYGAIRTTGRAPLLNEVLSENPNLTTRDVTNASLLERFWEYRGGGNISLRAGGSITRTNIADSVATTNKQDWDYSYIDNLAVEAVLRTMTFKNTSEKNKKRKELQLDFPRYGAYYGVNATKSGSVAGQATHGIATMAGGSIDIHAEDIYTQVGAFGAGDLSIYAQGSLAGRFLATGGDMQLTSLADFGAMDNKMNINFVNIENTLVQLGTGKLAIQSLGNVFLGNICNPEVTKLKTVWQLGYDEDSSVTINSALGSFIFSGEQDIVTNDSVTYRNSILPSSLSITTQKDIHFIQAINNSLYLTPSAKGQLSLIAGNDIISNFVNSEFVMSAADPTIVYGNQGNKYNNGVNRTDDGTMPFFLRQSNTDSPLHFDDDTSIVIMAGRDIANMFLNVPKKAEISADRDIQKIYYQGQNIHEGDISLINAGRDLIQPLVDLNVPQYIATINQAGRGLLMVRAGGEIDLGNSNGIQSTGSDIGNGYINASLFNESVPDIFNHYKGAEIAVISGYGLEESKEELATLFESLTDYGKEFSLLMATGNKEDESKAAQLKQEIIETFITSLLDGKQTGSGNISMAQSTIKTTSGQDDMYILAAGTIDVGTSIISTNKDTSKGLLTEGGGNINVFAEGDINVNESRVVTYFGGDIFILSNHGDINAGRGSKTTVSPMAAGYTDIGGILVNKFTAPAPGSGIRTLTVDPDGAGPITEPEQGTISLIAWEGVIDAGEAGISASNLILAATKILNAGNINFSDSGVGVPTTADAGPSIGAMAGSTTVSDTQSATQSIGQQVTDSGKKLAESVSKMAEDLTIKMLVFKFEGFGGDSGSTTE